MRIKLLRRVQVQSHTFGITTFIPDGSCETNSQVTLRRKAAVGRSLDNPKEIIRSAKSLDSDKLRVGGVWKNRAVKFIQKNAVACYHVHVSHFFKGDYSWRLFANILEALFQRS